MFRLLIPLNVLFNHLNGLSFWRHCPPTNAILTDDSLFGTIATFQFRALCHMTRRSNTTCHLIFHLMSYDDSLDTSADFIMLYDISITYVRHLCQMILQYSHFVRKLLGNVDKKYVYRASRVRVRILRLPIYLGLYNLCIIRIAMSLKNKWMWSILNICAQNNFPKFSIFLFLVPSWPYKFVCKNVFS